MRVTRLLIGAAAAVAAVLPLTACATAPGAGAVGDARVVVRIAASSHPADYEVHLARADGGFAAVHRMRSGETRAFTVPTGWMTVRIPGLCVVPTPATGVSTVEVAPDDCTLD